MFRIPPKTGVGQQRFPLARRVWSGCKPTHSGKSRKSTHSGRSKSGCSRFKPVISSIKSRCRSANSDLLKLLPWKYSVKGPPFSCHCRDNRFLLKAARFLCVIFSLGVAWDAPWQCQPLAPSPTPTPPLPQRQILGAPATHALLSTRWASTKPGFLGAAPPSL